ncbi:MAG TPA: hypothetical protein PLM53_03870 [Spirochaetota bacterium]|nr:hypothetical protein [Spirochaetota bacterium]HPC40212.1 hypothetical protein [Spirochaetota bacterium]HPL16192.1 hypothetical protein [Spirochaetota bacterium]HQF07314.1 hypothetical protein [Spirochaetota bacterium]HQH96215.1 hypothetical protein [Spirochaetota bacterium]
MNRLIYFAPLASLPLMALAQQRSDDSMKTDNPYVAAALIVIVILAVSVVITGYFRLKTRGRVTAAVVFGILDWLITAPVCISAGVNLYATVAIASVSAAFLAYVVIRHGQALASVLRRNDAEQVDADED